MISTSDPDTSGVSGAMTLTTGDAANHGNSGTSLNIETSKAVSGIGGNFVMSLGSADSDADSSMTLSSSSSSASAGGALSLTAGLSLASDGGSNIAISRGSMTSGLVQTTKLATIAFSGRI